MKRDLIDAIGKIDPRYIEEAAAVRKQAEASFDKTRTRAAEEAAPVILHTKKRSGWAVAAAALFLVLSVGTAWTFLSGKNVVGVDPSYVPGDSPAQTGGMDPFGTDLSENLLSPEETAAIAEETGCIVVSARNRDSLAPIVSSLEGFLDDGELP